MKRRTIKKMNKVIAVLGSGILVLNMNRLPVMKTESFVLKPKMTVERQAKKLKKTR